MTVLLIQFISLLFVAIAAPVVVMTRSPRNQTIGLSFYGVLLGLLMFVFRAPDVPLSQIVLGAVALPLMILLGLAKVRRRQVEQKARGNKAA